MVKIKVVNTGCQPLPAYATSQSAGMDLRANIESPITLHPMERTLVPNGITVLNTPGTIDSDYRGELKVLLVNLSNDDFVVNAGERVAQMVIARHETATWEEVEVLDETERGEGGYGHTGVK